MRRPDSLERDIRLEYFCIRTRMDNYETEGTLCGRDAERKDAEQRCGSIEQH